jgi:hypothetical protein
MTDKSHEDDNPNFHVEIRGDYLLAPMAFFCIFVPPLVLAIQLAVVPADILRAFVFTTGIMVWSIYVVSFVSGTWQLLKRRVRDRTAQSMQLGRMARLMAIIVFMAEEITSLVDRFGRHHLDWRTPVFQLAIIFALFAWAYMDRRTYYTVVDGKPVVTKSGERLG